MADLTAIGGIAGSVLNPISTWMQNRAQKKAQNREFANNKEMWHLANQYNSPEMQMQRLEKAGLNKNLVYGNGSVVGNTSTQTPKYQAPSLQRHAMEQINPLAILGAFADLKQKNAMANKATSEANWVDRQMAYDVIGKLHDNTMKSDITGRNYQWNKKMGNNIGNTDVDNARYNNLFLEKYQAETKDAKNRANLRKLDVEFYDQIPKQYQWIFQMARSILR